MWLDGNKAHREVHSDQSTGNDHPWVPATHPNFMDPGWKPRSLYIGPAHVCGEPILGGVYPY